MIYQIGERIRIWIFIRDFYSFIVISGGGYRN